MAGNLCEHCVGYCCRHIALPIDVPTTRKDFDDIRWYLLHGGISVFVEDGAWYLHVETTCRHLLPDNRCGIYETRPQICRAYDTDNCDYHSGDYDWQQHFTSAAQLDVFVEEYMRNVKSKKSGKKGNSVNRSIRTKRANLKKRKIAEAPVGVPRFNAAAADRAGIPLPVLGGPR